MHPVERHDRGVGHSSSTRLRYAAADRAILTIAARQHGVVTRAQLHAAGVPLAVIERRLALKKLRRVYRGVYLAGPLESTQGRALAAVLACSSATEDSGGASAAAVGAAAGTAAALRAWPKGGIAVASHWTALQLLELAGSGRRDETPVHVTVTGRDPRRPGIRIHRVCQLPRDEVTIADSVPVTTPARTLLDLANALPARDMERALTEALGKRLATQAALAELLDRYPGRPGTATLRALLGTEDDAVLRSEAERLFRSLVREAGLAEPEVNAEIRGVEVDFLWRAHRLVIEVDGAAYHATSDRFERDRRRDRTLVAAGYRVVRVTWRQIKHERLALAVQLTQALAEATTADPLTRSPAAATSQVR